MADGVQTSLTDFLVQPGLCMGKAQGQRSLSQLRPMASLPTAARSPAAGAGEAGPAPPHQGRTLHSSNSPAAPAPGSFPQLSRFARSKQSRERSSCEHGSFITPQGAGRQGCHAPLAAGETRQKQLPQARDKQQHTWQRDLQGFSPLGSARCPARQRGCRSRRAWEDGSSTHGP